MRALVIGARGAVGGTVVSTLRGQGHEVTPAGRRAPENGVALDPNKGDLGSLERIAREHHVVINASGAENPLLGRMMGDAVLVDISATSRYLAALAANAPDASIVLGAGLAPGLSTALVSELRPSIDDAVDVAVMLGSGEKHGDAAMAWTAGLIGTQITDADDDGTVYNFREHRWFTGPIGRRRYLRAGFPDHTLIGRERGLQIRSWLALSSPSATRALSLISHVPRARGLISHTPAFGSEDWAVTVTNRCTGETLHGAGIGQSHATGVITALAAEVAAENPPGRPITLDAILDSTDLARLPGINMIT